MYGCIGVHLVWDFSETSLQVLDSTNTDLLLDSGFKLSDIIVNLCPQLLDYILLKSGSISVLYFT